MNVLSLFDGMGAARLALQRAGLPVSNYYASEIDKYSLKISNKNFPDIVQLGDVKEVKVESLPKIDLLVGGSPCQGFSFAGKQLNFEDPRSALFFEFIRLIKETDPKYFLLENVRMKQEYQDVITEHLGVRPIMINSALVSAQNRVRLYWTNIPGIEQPKDKGIVLKDILEDGDTVLEQFYKSRPPRIYENKSPTLRAARHGLNLTKCGALRGRCIVDGKRQDHKGSVAGKTEQRLEIRDDEKTNTLTTVQKDNVVVTKDLSYRKLTPTECERLQTLPDNYTEGVSNTQRYKMLGNGFTVDVIAHILKQIPKEASIS